MRSGTDLLWRWLGGVTPRRRVSLFNALDRALVDAPSLCCDTDDLCAACRADTAPWLTGSSRLDPAVCG